MGEEAIRKAEAWQNWEGGEAWGKGGGCPVTLARSKRVGWGLEETGLGGMHREIRER